MSVDASVCPRLADAEATPPGPERMRVIRNAVWSDVYHAGSEAARLAVRDQVKASGLLTMRDFEALAAEARRDAASFDGTADELGAARASGDVAGPEARVRMSAGAWRYSPGDDGWDRGLYVADRFIAPLPHVHARVVHRDGGGNRTGTSFLLSVTDGGPRLVTGHLKIRDGSWASELGVTLPDEPKVIQAAGTAIRQLAEGAPEREAIARADGDGLAVPPRECLPDGYLITSGMPRAEALGVWAREVIPLAALMPNLADMIGASAFAPFVGPLRIQSHIVDAYGDADRGKTTALNLSAAVWGDCREVGGTVRLWNFTSDVSVARFLGNLGVLPAFVDEGGASGFTRDDWGKLVYRVAGGAQRISAEYQGQGNKVGLPWHGIMFVTGNARLGDGLTAGKWAGVPKRLVESAAPFTTGAEHAERLETLAGETFGHLGAEIIGRFTVADARQFHARAAEVVGMPAGGNPRTWAKELQAHVAGAMMLDDVCGTGTLLTDAAAEFAAAFLAEHCADPKHDADLMLEAIAESIAREPARWPTVAEYREHLMPPRSGFGGAVDPTRAELPQHGIAHFGMAGVRADDGAWVAVFPSVMHAEFTGPRDISEDRAYRELAARGVLQTSPSQRARGEWAAKVRVLPKPGAPSDMYKLALPADDGGDADEDAPQAPHVNSYPPRTPNTPNPAGQSPTEPRTQPRTLPRTPPPPTPNPPLAAAVAEGGAPPAEAAENSALCRKCHTLLSPWLREQGAEYHVGCSPADYQIPAFAPPPRPAPDDDGHGHQGDEHRQAAPPAPPSSADEVPVRRRWVVLGGDGRAYAAGGEILEFAPGTLAACRSSIGDVAALGESLGVLGDPAGVVYVPAAARESLGLPAVLSGELSKWGDMPHGWVESLDTGCWYVPEGAGLGRWMTVYRRGEGGERTYQGVAVAFPEWIDSAPSLGPLPAAELAAALDLIHQGTTYGGNGKGGVEFAYSPAATFGRLVDKRLRWSRTGRPDAVTLPPPYDRAARRPRGAPSPLRPPGAHAAPAAAVPEGWTVAQLDVRSCYPSAGIGTDFGIGDAEHRQGGELGKQPGAYLVRARAGAAAHESLTPFVPPAAAGRAREVLAWLDSHAARWLAECGVPLEVTESWTWPESQRVFTSADTDLTKARQRYQAGGSVPELAAAAVLKSMPNTFLGGWLASDFGGERREGDWRARYDWWLAVKTQAEVRKQRNLLAAIKAGTVRVLASQNIDSVYVAAPSLADIEAMPGTGGRPAVAEGNGKFKIEVHAVIGAELAAVLASAKDGQVRRRAIADALRTGE